MPIQITSVQNARVKECLKLEKRRQRDAQQQTVVEGAREVLQALQSGIVPPEAFICTELVSTPEAAQAANRLYELDDARQTRLYEVTPAVFEKLAYRGESGGIVLVIPYVARRLSELALGNPPFVAVIEGAEKPGNLGAILRTADAAGVDAVIVCTAEGQSGLDLHNPNVVRASLGTLFTVPVAQDSSATVQHWLRECNIQMIVTSPDAKALYTAVDLRLPTAVVMGSEADGLSQSWFVAADQQVQIPMHGRADSLNLSTATALLLYEVVRQRQAAK
ncbi:MAG: RNA methyltransferase [Caldilineaceae bacterium]|nr:RNA methyltransferase [Caldilineaceae bacterium]